MQRYVAFLLVVAALVLTPSNGFKRLFSSSSFSRVIRLHAGNPVDTSSPPAATAATPEYSFVRDDLRTYAMKLHTRDQAPKEGQQKAETPFTKWEPGRSHYLQFLVDSLVVYETLEELTQQVPALAPFRATGLERAQVLREDIAWLQEYDAALAPVPACGESGRAYASFLKALAAESLPKFMCHYYNHYFAHTAGGRMIGKSLADKLLEGKVLRFYQWDGDVKELLDGTRVQIDKMALQWSPEEKQACLEETMNCFRYGGSLMVYMKPPGAGGGGH